MGVIMGCSVQGHCVGLNCTGSVQGCDVKLFCTGSTVLG